MKGLLVRIGADHTYGGWNAPVDPDSGHFVYVPIPEKKTRFQDGMRRSYREILPSLKTFCRTHGLDLERDLSFPFDLLDGAMHLDPDFDFLTYGDNGKRRGAGLWQLSAGDLVVFYAGLRPIRPCGHRLLYALVGLYVVDEVVRLPDVPRKRWGENAHTRRRDHGPDDVVVRARPGVSGRLERCIAIGEWRDRAYRVRKDLLAAWGGLSVTNGYIQRSVVPPSFLDARKFYKWFLQHKCALVPHNA